MQEEIEMVVAPERVNLGSKDTLLIFHLEVSVNCQYVIIVESKAKIAFILSSAISLAQSEVTLTQK